VSTSRPTTAAVSGVSLTGDRDFPGGPGSTDHDPQRFGSLIDDLEEWIFGVFDDSTWVCPGHGSDTTLGAERASR
jgi:glyoxylase-like metal-dependent hydrolase (beta-lactamase superfamily II)